MSQWLEQMLGLEVRGVTKQQQSPWNRIKKGYKYGVMEYSICEDSGGENITRDNNVGLHGDQPGSVWNRAVLTALGDKGPPWGEATKWVFYKWVVQQTRAWQGPSVVKRSGNLQWTSAGCANNRWRDQAHQATMHIRVLLMPKAQSDLASVTIH